MMSLKELLVFSLPNLEVFTPSSFSFVENNTSSPSLISNITNITTSPSECLLIQPQTFIPWNNPDNIVSFEAASMTRLLKDMLFLPLFFLIGCPGNVINMAVFYKQGLKERINVCLFALSLSDGLYLVNNMIWFGEQLHLQFTTQEVFGPVQRFVTNNRLIVFHAFIWVSQIITAIIASERCFCVLQPLRSQTVLSSSTTRIIIIAVNIAVVSLFFLVTMRYHVICAYDLVTGSMLWTVIPGEFYLRHQQLITYLDVFIFGVGLPSLVIVVVVTTTIITAIKLRQAAAWRAETSSGADLSQRDIALTKMLVANSVFFIACVVPFIVFRLVFLLSPEVDNGRRHHNFYFMIQWILVIISYFNCSFNIVIYYVMGSRYRQTFWQLFRRQGKKVK